MLYSVFASVRLFDGTTFPRQWQHLTKQAAMDLALVLATKGLFFTLDNGDLRYCPPASFDSPIDIVPEAGEVVNGEIL